MTAGTVSLTDVSKRFIICHEKARSFQDALVHFVHRRNGTKEEFWALREVSFEAGQGETLGLIGRNGSGKSTTLKLITRILTPTSGSVIVNGRVSALIELGTGFHPDLTGRENIYLNGSIFGYGRKQMDRKFDEIVAFSELERFIDTAVKHYSSGMYARLGFSVATSVDPDILIMDEVLAVGDEAFQRKCLARIQEFKRLGKTILFVSHSLSAVEDLCDRVVWLDGGRVRAEGIAADMVHDYLVSVDSGGVRAQAASADAAVGAAVGPPSERRTAVARVKIVDAEGQPLSAVAADCPVRVRIDCALVEGYEKERLGLHLASVDGLALHWSDARLADVVHETGPRRGFAVFEFASLPLRPGLYELRAGLTQAGVEGSWRSEEHTVCRFNVDGQKAGKVVLDLPCRWLGPSELAEMLPVGARGPV